MNTTTANSFMIREWTKNVPTSERIAIIELFETIENDRNRLAKESRSLKKQLESAREVIEYYGYINNWYSKGILHKDKLVCPDMENMGTYNCGGKRARSWLKENK